MLAIPAAATTMLMKHRSAFLLLPFLFIRFRNSAAAQRHRPPSDVLAPSLRGDSATSSPRPPAALPPTRSPTTRPRRFADDDRGGSFARTGKRNDGRSDRGSSFVITSGSENCGNAGGQLFELDLLIGRDPCETSWTLERAVTDETTYHVDVDGREFNDVADAAASDPSSFSSFSYSHALCLKGGDYRFTIRDAFGDGITAPGYYILALDGVVLAGSSDFGYKEVTRFTVADREPILALISSSAAAAEESSSSDATIADGYDIDDAFSTWVPDRLSGIIDLSLVSTVQDSSERADDNDMLEGGSNSTQTTWMEILNDDFENGPGLFRASAVDVSDYVTYYPFVKERRGVIRLQNDSNVLRSSLHSNNIAMPADVMMIKIVFSYYANSMELHDGFCIDYLVNHDDGSATWHSQKCWHAVKDFDNGIWYDGAEVAFRMQKHHGVMEDTAVNSFRIRIRCKANSLHDDVLIDRVQLLGLVGKAELKNLT
mmetsp:Transcript_25542/g.54270  ORF Transcript_25542/g.54270 Transcript_25542/m.54270 type:complete len:486 (+) Transcript_25542:230-1687(+)